MINFILNFFEKLLLNINNFLLKSNNLFSFILKGLRKHNPSISIILYRSIFVGATILFLIGTIGIIACFLMAEEFVSRNLISYKVPFSNKIFFYFFENSPTFTKDYIDFINSHAFIEKFPIFGIEIGKRFFLIGLVAHMYMMLYQISKEYLKITDDIILKFYFYFSFYFSLTIYIYQNEYEIYTLLANFIDIFSFKFPKPIVFILENYYLMYVDYYNSQYNKDNLFLKYDWFFARYNVDTKYFEKLFLLEVKKSIMDSYFIQRKYPPTIDKLHSNMVFKQKFVFYQYLEQDYLLSIRKYNERDVLDALELDLSEKYKELSVLYPNLFFEESNSNKQPVMLTRLGITLSYNRAMDNSLFFHKLLSDFELEGQKNLIVQLKNDLNRNDRSFSFCQLQEKLKKLQYLSYRSKEIIANEKLKFLIEFINDISILQRGNKLSLFLEDLNNNSNKSLEQLITIINKRSTPNFEEFLPTSIAYYAYTLSESSFINSEIKQLISGKISNIILFVKNDKINITKEFALTIYKNPTKIEINSNFNLDQIDTYLAELSAGSQKKETNSSYFN